MQRAADDFSLQKNIMMEVLYLLTRVCEYVCMCKEPADATGCLCVFAQENGNDVVLYFFTCACVRAKSKQTRWDADESSL